MITQSESPMSKKQEKLDQTDIDILNILQEDGSKTQKEIAGILRRPISGIYDRLKKLERLCGIDRYHIKLDRTKFQKSFDVQILVRLKNNDAGAISSFKTMIQDLPSIYESCRISGSWDFVLKGNFKYIGELRQLIEHDFEKCPLIKRTAQLIILDKVEFSRPVSLEDIDGIGQDTDNFGPAYTRFYKPLTAN